MKKQAYDLAVVALHPIQYQAGLWRAIANHPRFDLHVIYLDRVGIDGSIDPTMKAPMQWQMPLLDGYGHEFVTNLSPFRFTPIVSRINPSLLGCLRSRSYDAVIVHGYLILSNWLALLAAKTRGFKLIYRGEGSLRGGAKHDSLAVNLVKHPINAFFLRACDAIAYSSEDNREYQLARGAPEERLFPMPCAVDNERLEALSAGAAPPAEFRERYGLPRFAHLVVSVGRFAEHKRMTDCVAAFAAPPLRSRTDVHLVVIGDGPLRGDLERQIRDSGLGERVHLLGFLNQPQVVEALLASDLFVLASSQGDPSPKALSEALFLKRPAVCSDGVGTCQDLITPGENGFIYPSKDPTALADCIVRVLEDDGRRRAMGERSHQVASANDFRAGVESLAAKLDELMEATS